MKVTYNWLKDFVEIKISPQVLAQKLTMAGLEVTSLEKKDGDFVFEIEVTSNRSDCLSVMGIAREVAAITNKKFNVKSLKFNAKNIKHSTLNMRQLSIKVEDKKDCPLYTAKIIKDVKVKSSPDWLKKRLQLLGCRSVNNIVDITNYILFEWGQPLHVFDLDKLAGNKIVVRRAKDNEKIITIDAETRQLNKNILVIADARGPIAIVGIMGGKDTEVTEDTKNVLLEAAVFNPIIVRRGRQKLGTQSESSLRFERGIDLEKLEMASGYGVNLIREIAQGRCVLVKSSGLPKKGNKKITLDISSVHNILGINIPTPRIKGILNNLEFKVVSKAKDRLNVEIPSHRLDVSLEIDLIEEIARIFGYENIPKTQSPLIPQISPNNTRGLVSLIRNILVGLGLNETVTYSLIDKDLWERFNTEERPPAIEILNPLSKEQGLLRPGLIPSLARCIAYNLNQKQDYINIFEIAKAFSVTGQSPEELVLGVALCGIKSRFIPGYGLIKEEVGLLHLKGMLQALFEQLGIKDYDFKAQGDTYEIAVYVRREKIGGMARLKESILNYLDIKNRDVWVAQVSLDRLLPYIELKKRFVSLPKYPGISRDISLILQDKISIDEVLALIREKGRPLLCEVEIIEPYYKGKQIPPGFKGLTVSCLYRSDERTLTEAEVNPIHSSVVALLVERFPAQIR